MRLKMHVEQYKSVKKWEGQREYDLKVYKVNKKPGILSALSPTSEIISTNWAGLSVPYFLAKSSMPNEVILEKTYMQCEEPSWEILPKKPIGCGSTKSTA